MAVLAYWAYCNSIHDTGKTGGKTHLINILLIKYKILIDCELNVLRLNLVQNPRITNYLIGRDRRGGTNDINGELAK